MLVVIVFALLNRARGSRLYGLTDSTLAGRLIATGLMAAVTAWASGGPSAPVLAWTWASLMLWCSFGWGRYFVAATGGPIADERESRWVDWVMDRLRLPTDTPLRRRIWGSVAMGLRQSFLTPSLVGLAILSGHPDRAGFALLTPLLGLCYLPAGFARPRDPIPVAELALGAALGLLILGTVR